MSKYLNSNFVSIDNPLDYLKDNPQRKIKIFNGTRGDTHRFALKKKTIKLFKGRNLISQIHILDLPISNHRDNNILSFIHHPNIVFNMKLLLMLPKILGYCIPSTFVFANFSYFNHGLLRKITNCVKHRKHIIEELKKL